MNRGQAFFAGALLVVSSSCFVTARAAEEEEEADVPSLQVSGQGEVEVEPDMAVVELGATAQAPEASAAQEAASTQVRETLERIKGLGIPAEAIRTTTITLHPVYRQPDPRFGAPDEAVGKIEFYRATSLIEVTVNDITRVGDVIDNAVSAGSNELRGISFRLKDDLAARKQALRRAVEEARAKAEAIASAMDAALGQVREVVEGGISVGGPRFDSMRMMAMEASTPVEPGRVKVEASIQIRYALRQ